MLLDFNFQASNKMRNYHYFLLVLFMFMSTILSHPLPSMLDDIMQKCSLDKSQNKLGMLPELKGCQNWTIIISTQDYSDANKNEIECLLLYDSMVSFCKDEQLHEQFFQLLKTEPNVTSPKDVCKYLLNLPQADSPTVHNIIKTQEVCEHWCGYYQNSSIISSMMCAKSHLFYTYSNNIHVGPATSNDNAQNSLKDPSKLIVATSEMKAIETNNTHGHAVVETRTGEEGNEIISEANAQNVMGSDKVLSEPNAGSSPKGDNSIISSWSSSTVATHQVNETQAGQDGIQKTDTDHNSLDPSTNDQQAPPMTSNLNDQNTGQGQMYDGDEEISYNTEQGKEQKVVKPEVVPDGNDDIDDDDEEVIRNKLKAPEVSQLSDRFEYDADLSGSSYFFSYFSFTCIVLVIGYVLYHNKQKVVALLVEGRHSRRPQRSRRPNSANYHKLDSNLEEALSSSVNKNPSHVIY